MLDSVYQIWQAPLAYSYSAFIVFFAILCLLFLIVSQVQLVFFRICGFILSIGIFVVLGFLIWPSDGEQYDPLVSQGILESFSLEAPLDSYDAMTWSSSVQHISVVSLQTLLKNSSCTFKDRRQLKSMKSGFFISLAHTYDLLLHKKKKNEFMVQLRDRQQGKVIKTLSLKLNEPVIFKIYQQQYKVFYEYTDGLANVVSVTLCSCTKKSKS